LPQADLQRNQKRRNNWIFPSHRQTLSRIYAASTRTSFCTPSFPAPALATNKQLRRQSH
jgi:hypothetical protein